MTLAEPYETANGRRVYTTRSGLQIGLRYEPPKEPMGDEAERLQRLLLAPERPLALDQAAVLLGVSEE